MAKKPSMDTIRTPDLDNLNAKQSTSLNTFDRYTRAEDNSGKVRADFTRAQVVRDFEVKKEPDPDDPEVMAKDFSARRVPKTAANALDKGVKIRGVYVARRRIITAVCIFIAVVIFIMLFFPPIFSANDEMSGCRREDLFADQGITHYKAQIMENKHVYNIEALKSDISDNYRICTVAFDAKNYMPFAVSVDDYVIDSGGDYDGRVVYSTYLDKDSLTIPPFSSKTIKIDVLIYSDGLKHDDFDKAITSLTFLTKGTKKHIGKSIELPCIPAKLSVSDVITFDPDV